MKKVELYASGQGEKQSARPRQRNSALIRKSSLAKAAFCASNVGCKLGHRTFLDFRCEGSAWSRKFDHLQHDLYW